MTYNYLKYKDFRHSFTKSDEEPKNYDEGCHAHVPEGTEDICPGQAWGESDALHIP